MGRREEPLLGSRLLALQLSDGPPRLLQGIEVPLINGGLTRSHAQGLRYVRTVAQTLHNDSADLRLDPRAAGHRLLAEGAVPSVGRLTLPHAPAAVVLVDLAGLAAELATVNALPATAADQSVEQVEPLGVGTRCASLEPLLQPLPSVWV
ncbi:MAG: hypothetical protein COZ57_10510, partial [Armatimonadetes bacterium CG_4_8_14_3_um_filter_66_20]